MSYLSCSESHDLWWAVVVAQRKSIRLMTERSLIKISGLFSSLLYPISTASLIRPLLEVQHF